MNPNPYLKKLGFNDGDRVAILHADDIGMYQGGLTAYQEIAEFGLLSSAATMVPCPWFPAAATLYHALRQTHSNLDMGVHLTLTSEWEGYRWGPISTRNTASGLLDDEGYFYPLTVPMQEHGRTDAVLIEIEAQLKRALAAGIDVTHIDSHMGSIFHPNYMPGYIELAQKYHIPALALRWQANNFLARGMGGPEAKQTALWLQELEAGGFPLLDSVYVMPLESYEKRLEVAQQWLERLAAGIHYFIIHPCQDTPELRATAPDWRSRVADYELFTNPIWQQSITASGVQVIDWQAIRNVMAV